MTPVADVLGLVTEVFTWVGFGGGAALGLLALVLKVADGTWLPTTGVVDDSGGHPVMRWIDVDGNVNEAVLDAEQRERLAGRDAADIWYRRGWLGGMRLQAGSPAVRGVLGVAMLLIGVGVVATIVQLIAMALG